TIGVGGIGSGDEVDLGVGGAGGPALHIRGVIQATEAVDDGRGGELCRAEALDEITAHGLAALLESGEHLVGQGETTDDILGYHTAPGDHTVAVQPRLTV